MEEVNIGYIYIFKCIIGSGSNICKIGVTKDFQSRLKQHVRTPYYGFMPYIEFTTGNPIATVFKVREYSDSDALIKELFSDYQVGNLEIYSIDYDEAIKKLYFGLKDKNRLIDLIKENYSSYDFLDIPNETENTKISNFKAIVKEITTKYGDKLPEEIVLMLRDKEDYISNCNSHYIRGNYVDFPNDMILDLNYNREKRLEILNKLKKYV